MHRVIGKWNPLGLVFYFTKFDAITCPCGTVYYRDEKVIQDVRLAKHEQKHLDQIKEDGAIVFTFKYLYYSLRYGYKNNPYEVEARKE